MTKSKGGDAAGWKRGARGVDREDNSEFMKSFDPKADRKIYGPGYVGKYNTVICRATHITKGMTHEPRQTVYPRSGKDRRQS
jgi:hypothetical protein